MIFKDRSDGGRVLAKKLNAYRDRRDAIVLGLPRGGVVTAAIVADKLHLPLDIIVTRKIGAPQEEELAIGAIGEDGQIFLDETLVTSLAVSKDYLNKTIAKEQAEADRRLRTYRGNRSPLVLKNKTAIIVDDGVATGATMLAAIQSAKAKGAKMVVAAVPVAAADSWRKICREATGISVDTPQYFGAVGNFYEIFPQTEDAEVIKLLDQNKNIFPGS